MPIAGKPQGQLMVQGAAYSAEVTLAMKAGRCKQKQSIRYYIQPCTLRFEPCAVCEAIQGRL
jgi:hypothetical protein